MLRTFAMVIEYDVMASVGINFTHYCNADCVELNYYTEAVIAIIVCKKIQAAIIIAIGTDFIRLIRTKEFKNFFYCLQMYYSEQDMNFTFTLANCYCYC